MRYIAVQETYGDCGVIDTHEPDDINAFILFGDKKTSIRVAKELNSGERQDTFRRSPKPAHYTVLEGFEQ